MHRFTVHFSGRVQGVGFRHRTTTMARRYPITGWVMNLADGRVKMEAEANEVLFSAFLKELVDSMGTNITEHSVDCREATGEFDRFETRYQ